MLVYMPHRSNVADSMKGAKEYDSVELMKRGIAAQGKVSYDEISIARGEGWDELFGFRNSYFVFAKNGEELIGRFSSDYDVGVWNATAEENGVKKRLHG